MSDIKLPLLADAAILHLWDTHVSEPNSKYPLAAADKIAFANAVLATQQPLFIYDTIDERAEFEAAVQEEYGTSAPSMLLRDADGDYLTLNTEWVFWLKRAALTEAPPKENNYGDTP